MRLHQKFSALHGEFSGKQQPDLGWQGWPSLQGQCKQPLVLEIVLVFVLTFMLISREVLSVRFIFVFDLQAKSPRNPCKTRKKTEERTDKSMLLNFFTFVHTTAVFEIKIISLYKSRQRQHHWSDTFSTFSSKMRSMVRLKALPNVVDDVESARHVNYLTVESARHVGI